jgi:serine/threonine-protein kinase
VPASYQLASSRDAPVRLGRYELLGQLAIGGMAEIHLARLAGVDGFEKIVVVKRLLPELVASPAYVAMFLDEGKLVARLDHPNICEVHELGRDGAEYYLAMPYLDGIPVHELIARPRDPDRSSQLRVAAGVIAQACEGLHHAHELRAADGEHAHLVHRDVSPSNLFVTANGTVKVLDFGIAKVRGGAATEVGMIKGKTQYMAPEQLLGDPVDRRCDVFALGIVLFELATHQRLFKRASDYLAARAILEDPIPRADTADPAVPSALADVIARALARDPKDRHATARELGAAVTTALTPASPSEIAAAVSATDELSAQRTRQQRVLGEARSRLSDVATRPFVAPVDDITTVTPHPRSRRIWWIAATCVLALGAIALVFAVRAGDGDDDENAQVPPTIIVTKSEVTYNGKPKLEDLRPPGPTQLDVKDDKPPVTDTPVERAPVRRAPPPYGQLSIDSTPYATIFFDGAKLGVTPMVKRSVPPGNHKLRAVLRDGRSKEWTINIPIGRLAPPVQLTW